MATFLAWCLILTNRSLLAPNVSGGGAFVPAWSPGPHPPDCHFQSRRQTPLQGLRFKSGVPFENSSTYLQFTCPEQIRVLKPFTFSKAKSQADQNEIDRRAKEAVLPAKKQKALETTPIRRAIQAQERKKATLPTRPSTSKAALPPSQLPAPTNYRVPKCKQPGTPPVTRRDPQTPPSPFIESPLLLPTAKRRTETWPISPSHKVDGSISNTKSHIIEKIFVFLVPGRSR